MLIVGNSGAGEKITQLDIIAAYLSGKVEEEMFMQSPEYLKESLDQIIRQENWNSIGQKAKRMLQEMARGNMVYRLNKTLYRLHQTGRQWHKRLIIK